MSDAISSTVTSGPAQLVRVSDDAQVPVYRQIRDQIIDAIRSGSLVPGDKLPPERELAETLGVARGTVQKAYESLAHQGVIAVTRGRGSFVAEVPRAEPVDRRAKAVARMTDLVIALEEMQFTHRQIGELFSVVLAEREEAVARLAVATIDCNPEALVVYQQQIAMLARLPVSRYLLQDLGSPAEAVRRLQSFDLIVTTTTHLAELESLVPQLSDRLVGVAVAPASDTLLALGALAHEEIVGVVHASDRFLTIIDRWLARSGFSGRRNAFRVEVTDEWPSSGERVAIDLDDWRRFLARCSTLVIPAGAAVHISPGFLEGLNEFRQRGGRVIPFEYRIEQGSILHLQEGLHELLRKHQKATAVKQT